MSLRVLDDHKAGPDQERFTTAADHVVDAAFSRLDELRRQYSGATAEVLLRALIQHEFCGRLAVVSSFGAESAVLLALIAEIDRGVPILFLDTGKLFGETLRYRDKLIAALGLTDVRTLHPRSEDLAAGDADGMLWLDDPDRCCALRKVVRLASALNGFDAWVSGRKRYQGSARAALAVFEVDNAGRIKINPLAGWSRARIEVVFAARNLPRHPLVEEGYLSVGCMTCTDRVRPGEDPRWPLARPRQDRMRHSFEPAVALGAMTGGCLRRAGRRSNLWNRGSSRGIKRQGGRYGVFSGSEVVAIAGIGHLFPEGDSKTAGDRGHRRGVQRDVAGASPVAAMSTIGQDSPDRAKPAIRPWSCLFHWKPEPRAECAGRADERVSRPAG